MGQNEDGTPQKVSCIMCKLGDEDDITGPLSSKEDISAHQNCLLYSSGLYCKSSPAFDDLFGFDVEDVKNEYNRGKKLTCHKCKRKGATAGCENARCKRSYHYPCATKDRAKLVEKASKGTYTLYCEKHDPERPRGLPNQSPSYSSGSTGSKRKEPDRGGMTSESDSDTSLRIRSRKRKCEEAMFDSDESDGDHGGVLGIPPVETDTENITPPEKPGTVKKKYRADISTNQKSVMQSARLRPTFSPAVEQLGLARQSAPRPEEESRDEEEHGPDISGVFPCRSGDGDDTDIENGPAESQSLIAPEYQNDNVTFHVIVDSGPSIDSENIFGPCSSCPAPVAACDADMSVPVPECASTPHHATTPVLPKACVRRLLSQDSTPQADVGTAEPAVSPDRSSPTAPSGGDVDPDESVACPAFQNTHPMSPDPPECQATPTDGPLDLTAPPGASTASPQPTECAREASLSGTGAVLFWMRCNEVGCTQAIFTELTHQISSLAEKVQTQHATQQDCAAALKILEASGKLPAIFTRLELDFEEREQELQRKRKALRDARAVLNHLN